MPISNNECFYQIGNKDALDGSIEQVRNGIWPRSNLFWMSAFYMAIFILRPWEKLLPWLGIIHFERLYALLMITAIIISGAIKFKMTSQNLTVLLFWGAIGLTGMLAKDPSLSWGTFYKYFTLVIFYFVLILVIRNPYELIFLIVTYLIIMGVYLTKSQWEYFIHGCHQYRMGVLRLIGIDETFGDPNALAASIVFSLPLFLFIWRNREKISRSWPGFWQKWFSPFLLFYFGLALSSIVLTRSRAGMLSFILFLILICLKGRNLGKKLSYILFGMFFLALLWQIMPQDIRNRFRTIYDEEAGPANAQTSTQGRIEGFKAGLKMFRRFPLSGVGPGNFISYRTSYLDGLPVQAHNFIGQMLGETGLLGTIAFILMVATSLLNCRRIVALQNDDPDLTTNILADLAVSCRDVIILLLFEGLAGHNLLRFNWLWIAAFSNIAFQYLNYKSCNY